jgi:hypothetical protein
MYINKPTMERAAKYIAKLTKMGTQNDDPVLQKFVQKAAYNLHRVSHSFANKRDGYERSRFKYTSDEKYELMEHVMNFLLIGEYPDFEDISEHMLRTPTGLEQQTQKLFVEANWTWENLVEWYGISPENAKHLIAPQHK